MFPAGKVAYRTQLSEYAGVSYPIWGDLGYRFGGKFFVGASAFYAFGSMGHYYAFECGEEGWSCSTYEVRVGAEAQFHPLGRAPLDPWVGLGFGYEWLSTKFFADTYSFTSTRQGWDFLQVQGGVDFALGSMFRLGPFVAFSMGQYDKFSRSLDGQSGEPVDIPNKALHYWFTVGAKLTILP